MTFIMQANSTISGWQAPDGSNILFPEMEFKFGKQKKPRGGAPVCCPNFGDAPTDGPYEGITLPKHGHVRTCGMKDGHPVPGNRALRQDGPRKTEDSWIQNSYTFLHPCHHKVQVQAKLMNQELYHRIWLETESTHNVDMPYSIGFHPYFATAGSSFQLRQGDECWSSADLKVNEPFYVPKRGPLFDIVTRSSIVQIEILRGYTGFYIWTDRPDLYICVEPVRIDPVNHYLILAAGEAVSCECRMTHASRS
jgi:hypothetical protein